MDAVRQAWRPPQSAEEQQAWLDLLTNEGYSLLLTGSIVPSIDAYSAAYDFARAHPEIADGELLLETVLKPLGNNYTRLGDYEQALFIHQKAASLALALGDHEALAGVYANLANTAGNMGRPRSALEYCRKGLAMAGPRSAIAGLLYSELADAWRQMGREDSAIRAITQSIAILESAKDHPSAGYWLLTTYQVAGDLQGKTPTALEYYQKAYRLQARLALRPGEVRSRDRAKLFFRLGALYAGMQQPAAATRWLDSCLAVLLPGRPVAALHSRDLYAENTLVDALYVLAGLQKDAGEAIRLYELSFVAARIERTELITGSSKERWVSDSRSRYGKALDFIFTCWSRHNETKYAAAMLRFLESSKAQLLLDEQLQQQQLRAVSEDSIGSRIRLLERAMAYYQKEMLGGGDSTASTRLRETGWELAKLRKTRTARELTGIGDSTVVLPPPGLVARNYFADDTLLYTVECDHNGVRFVSRLLLNRGWQDSLRSFTLRWFGGGANRMINQPTAYYREAAAIYDRFFAAHPFQPDQEYILLPDGALSLLPVEALIETPFASPTATPPGPTGENGLILPEAASSTPTGWPFVIRHTTISYGYSLKTLWQKQGRGGNGFSGFFISANGRDLPGLQATKAERLGIEPAIGNGQWYIDSLATATNFRKALTGSSILHISSHAFTGRDSDDAPHIELYDAPFYLFELRGLDQHPSLVVLSACRTGDGRYVTGDGVQSLARAFTAGGASAVVAGWWNVNDEAAAKLMSGFYQQITTYTIINVATANNPATAAANNPDVIINAALSLRRAKLAWLNDPKTAPVLQLPYYWAALQYEGNPTPFSPGTATGLKGQPGPPHSLRRLILCLILTAGGLLTLALTRRRL